jgi:hypothetical protein
MKRLFSILLGLGILLNLPNYSYGASQWDKSQIAGTASPSDIDSLNQVNNEAQDRLLKNYRHKCKLTYATAATITVGLGELAIPNSDGSVVKYRANTSATTVTWSNLDTGSEANGTTYYVYAIADTDATTFTVKLSTSSTAPSSSTYYRYLGYFYNDASGNIGAIVDNDYSQAVFSSWETKVDSTVYQASTDGFVVANISLDSALATAYISGYTDSSASPSTLRCEASFWINGTTARHRTNSFTMPVKKGDYWKVVMTNESGSTPTETIYWIPLGS